MSTIEQRANFVERVNTIAAEEVAEFAATHERHPNGEDIQGILTNAVTYIARNECDGVVPMSHLIALMLDWSHSGTDGYVGAVDHLLALIDKRGLKISPYHIR